MVSDARLEWLVDGRWRQWRRQQRRWRQSCRAFWCRRRLKIDRCKLHDFRALVLFPSLGVIETRALVARSLVCFRLSRSMEVAIARARARPSACSRAIVQLESVCSIDNIHTTGFDVASTLLLIIIITANRPTLRVTRSRARVDALKTTPTSSSSGSSARRRRCQWRGRHRRRFMVSLSPHTRQVVVDFGPSSLQEASLQSSHRFCCFFEC